MVRRALGIILLLALFATIGGVFAARAQADDTGTWEEGIRDLGRAEFGTLFKDLTARPRVYWKSGLHVETPKKALSLHFGWEIQADATWYSTMDAEVEAAAKAQWTSGFETRRNRIYVEGLVLKYWYFRIRYNVGFHTKPQFQDFFLEWAGFHDAWGLKGLPLIRGGQVKESISLEQLTSSKWILFAEHALPVSGLIPGRNPGIRLQGSPLGGRVTYGLGWFAVNAANLNEVKEGDGQAVTGRLTGLPWAPADHPGRLIHIGVGTSYRWDDTKPRFRTRAESNFGPYLVDTGEFLADQVWLLDLEFLALYDRLSLQGEWIQSRVRSARGGWETFWGCYAQAGYYLTPPGPRFRRSTAVMGRTLPKTAAFGCGDRGTGAWQVALRYSYIDLDSDPHKGGVAWDVTLGLNWFPRDNARVTLNWIHSNVHGAYGVPGADGNLDAVILRLQYEL